MLIPYYEIPSAYIYAWYTYRESVRQIRQRSMSFDSYTTLWWLHNNSDGYRMATRSLEYFQSPQDLHSPTVPSYALWIMKLRKAGLD
jgi:hypothetical protein